MNKLSRQLSEDARLDALKQTALLDSSDEDVFDELIELLAGVFERPIAALSLVDRDRVFLKSKTGVDFHELSRDGSFCSVVVESGQDLIVRDARKDPRFSASPLVEDGGVSFYVGTPIEVFPGCCIGSLCVLGMDPGEPTDLMLRTLAMVARQVGHLVTLRRELMLKSRIHTETLLTAGTLHEIKNSLTPVINYLDLLVGDRKHEEQERVRDVWIERASAGVCDAVDMLREIRFDGAVTRRRAATETEIGQVIEDIVRQVSPAAARAGVTIRRPSSAGDGAMTGAECHELRQVVSNLVLNAIDAMPDGGELSISTGLNGDKLHLEVADQGVGMTESQAAQCFDPLFSTKQGGVGGFGGTGIGLTVVKQIVGDHGGTIGVRSEAGRGTTFLIDLPWSASSASDEAEAERQRNGGLRVLVVDDEAVVLKSVEEVLRVLGHEAMLIEGPAEALKTFEEDPSRFDLAIVDLGLMSMNGARLARRMRDIRSAFPVVIASGQSSGETNGTGEFHHLDKPFRLDQLRSALEQAVASS